MIGWHINRGWNQAPDFFPASRFRDRFNRPDILRLVLETLDEAAAIKQANAVAKRREDTRPLIVHLPPKIRIIGTADGTHVATGTARLDYALRSPSGQPVGRIEVLLDGRRIKDIAFPVRPVAADVETNGTVTVALAQHDGKVGLIAYSGDLASEPVSAKFTWDGAPAAGNAPIGSSTP